MQRLISVFLGIAILAGVVFLLYSNKLKGPVQSDLLTYTSVDNGVSFQYPKNYAVTEKDLSVPNKPHFSVTLVDKTAAAATVKNGEGPTSITLDIIRNYEDIELKDWLTRHDESNFKLSPTKVLATTTISGAEAAAYTWSGLYEGMTIAIAHRADFLLFSVTYLTPQDAIRADFAKIVSSLKLQ